MKDVKNEGQSHPVKDKQVFEIVSLLKDCSKWKDLHRGLELHTYIFQHKLHEKDCYIASSLVSMYARCGALAKAQKVLKELPFRDVVMWNALMAGYAQQGQGEEALNCFDRMQQEGHCPDGVTFTCALKACGILKAVVRGEKIHEKVLSLGMLEKDIVLGNTLVDMYARCSALAKAQQVLHELPVRDVVTWNALMAGYVEQGQGEKALNCFTSMQCEGHSPSFVTFVCALQACGIIGSANEGEKIHEKIVNLGMLDKNIVLGNTLVDMYARCGALAKAHQMFQDLSVRDVVTWNVLIAGYVQQEQCDEALKWFERMLSEGHFPDAVTLTCTLRACGSTGNATKGEKIHDNIFSLGLLEKDNMLGNTLVEMYARCGALIKAQQVLHELFVRDVVTWNGMIAGYVQHGLGEEALKCFHSMQLEGYFADVVTFTCVLKACASIQSTSKGEEIHEKIKSLGMLEKDTVLGCALIDMYARCGAFAKAQQVLGELPIQNVTTWNALIAGYVQQEQGKEALNCVHRMEQKGYSPNVITYICALKACGIVGAMIEGEKIYDKILSLGMLEQSVILRKTLLDMYIRCGAPAKVQQVFQELPVREVVTWNALIAAYALQGQGEEALKCFDSMHLEGYSPDVVTFNCVLKACGSIVAYSKGEEIHGKIVNLGILENESALGNTLIDMYARCGAVTKAAEVLNALPNQNVVAWNALIGGYAQLGQSEGAVNCIDKMHSKGIEPNPATLACVLNAYSHSGLLDQGEMCFFTMSTDFGITPDVECYFCMVDLFARAGNFIKALRMIEQMPSADYLPAWHTLLGGCHKWRDVTIGSLAFKRTVHLDKSDAAAHVYMANIFSAAGMPEET